MKKIPMDRNGTAVRPRPITRFVGILQAAFRSGSCWCRRKSFCDFRRHSPPESRISTRMYHTSSVLLDSAGLRVTSVTSMS